MHEVNKRMESNGVFVRPAQQRPFVQITDGLRAQRGCGHRHGQQGQFVHARSFLIVEVIEHGFEHEPRDVFWCLGEVKV